ncbi:L,D-transpeptidase family protein [Roseomonas hellenica]|uniref:L,D-transpeptidase family protein n=1 Tax=Plastoroseomonas hellenica TaxID=2687306 RepID=A0ABS5F4N8_9PROT|nr:L,D-transpeptidase family protein [Plastoroseomonas hellenica]MBR0667507.1 L,D-transpeptidase family protein [Plastoroseomonas hellenica]
MTATARVLPEGRLIFRGEVFRCALGKGGVRADKSEGDGATPTGLLPLRRLLYRADRVAAPECALRREPIGAEDGWCDDPAHPDYNRQITLPHPARHERLWRGDALYDVVVPLGWNDAPVVRGRGSAIFLHLARPDYAPTEGCVALSLVDLRRVLSLGVEALAVER